MHTSQTLLRLRNTIRGDEACVCNEFSLVALCQLQIQTLGPCFGKFGVGETKQAQGHNCFNPDVCFAAFNLRPGACFTRSSSDPSVSYRPRIRDPIQPIGCIPKYLAKENTIERASGGQYLG